MPNSSRTSRVRASRMVSPASTCPPTAVSHLPGCTSLVRARFCRYSSPLLLKTCRCTTGCNQNVPEWHSLRVAVPITLPLLSTNGNNSSFIKQMYKKKPIVIKVWGRIVDFLLSLFYESKEKGFVGHEWRYG